MTCSKSIFFSLAGISGSNQQYFYHRVAGHCLITNRSIGALEPFAVEPSESSVAVYSFNNRGWAAEPGRPIYDSEFWIGNSMRRVRSWLDGSHYRIRVTGIAEFSISGCGSEILLLEQETHDDDLLVEAALGPALVLALAIGGIFCLHASTIKIGNSAILFLGDSGAGKSTLAKLLQDDGAGVVRITDDISPVQCVDGRFEIRPNFPQLKLPSSQQYLERSESSIPISSICSLHRSPAGEWKYPPIFRRRLAAVDSFKKLVGQSVASRLFAADLLRRHTRQMAELTSLVPVYELGYPSGAEHVESIREFLLSTLNK